MDTKEHLTSIASCAADIQRWTLQMALNDRLSIDRLNDILHATNVIDRHRATLRQIADSGNSMNAHLARSVLENEHGNG